MLKLGLEEKKKKGRKAANVPVLVVFKNKRQPSHVAGITTAYTGREKAALIDALSIFYRGTYFFLLFKCRK